MKRRNLPERELHIAKRLRETRQSLHMTQREFAEQIGIGRQRLASYEEGRVPLRYDLALRLCRQFITSEKWLATGEGNRRAVMDLRHEQIVSKIPADLPFSEAYDKFLAPCYDELFRAWGGSMRIDISPHEDHSYIQNFFVGAFTAWIESLSPDRVPTLCWELLERGEWLMKHQDSLPPYYEYMTHRAVASAKKTKGSEAPEQFLDKNNLTNVIASDNIAPVKELMPSLIARLKRATKERGKKSALAKFLGVPLPSVTPWLSGKREPGGEYALQMLKWVEQEERRAK